MSVQSSDWRFPAARLDALLEEAGIDLLLATSKHNIRYLLGGHHHHFFAHMDAIGISRYLPILIYPRGRPENAAYIANRNEKDSIAVRASEEQALWPGAILPSASTSQEAMGLAIEHIRRHGLAAGTIGLELPFLPTDAFLALRDATGRRESSTPIAHWSVCAPSKRRPNWPCSAKPPTVSSTPCWR